MATVVKRSKSPFWQAVIRKVNGVWTTVTTKMRKRGDAMRFALDMQAKIDEARAGRLVESTARKFITDVYQQANNKVLEMVTIKGYWNRWLGAKEKECKLPTMLRYRSAYDSIMKYLKKRADDNIIHCDKALITDYRDDEAKRTSVASANMNVKILRIVLEDAFREGLVTVNEAKRVKTIKRDKATRFKRLPFTADQLRKIFQLDSLPDDWRGMTLMGLYTGQRLKDISTARWGQLDLVSKVWAFVSSKTGHNTIVPLHPALLAHLQQIRPKDAANDTPIFPRANEKVERTGKTGQLSKEFHDILAKVGLAKTQSTHGHKKGRDTKRDMSPLSFHSLRSTMTSLLKELGASQGVAMDIIGHDTPAISDHYTTISDGIKREWINKIPDYANN